QFLSRRGVLYMVLVEENKPQQIAALLRKRGLCSEVCLRKRARNEGLMIMKVKWADSCS
ncbi:hypothetical protein B484DRAFT_441770, partial [Ochromonadaceae sp. CCMP2298]